MKTPEVANIVNAQTTTRKRFWLYTAVLLIFLAALPTMAQTDEIDLGGAAPTTFTDDMLVHLDAYVADVLTRYAIPGATIAIVQNGEVIHLNGFGLRALGNDAPVTSDTLFMIGSVPKSMTALMIGTLIDQGILNWDTPVANVLPTFALATSESSRTVTFRDLLSMRSGLPSFDISLFMQPYSPEQIIGSLAALPLVGKPGETYAYSNQGYAAAGFVAAVAAGAHYGSNLYSTYAQLMQERVFDLIGMKRTTFDFSSGVNDPNVTSPHTFDLTNGGLTTFPVNLEEGAFSIIPAGGSTWSNAEDLARYLITQMNHGVAPSGERVISEARLLDTWQPGIHTPYNTDYALGWVIKPDYHGLHQIEYGGGNLGYTSFISFLPEANLGVVVLTNRIAGDSFTADVTEYVYETAFGLDHMAGARHFADEQGLQGLVEQMRGGIEVEVDPATVARNLGDYEHNLQVHLNQNGGLVLAAAFGDFPLYAVPGQPNTFVLGLTFGLGVQFAPDGSSLTISAGDSQPPVTIARKQ